MEVSDELCHKQVMESRNQISSGKTVNGDQPLKSTSSIILHRSCCLGISSTQANQPTEPKQLKLTSSPFYSGHAACESSQLKRTAHTALAAQFEELSLAPKEKREMHRQRHKQYIKKKMNEYLLKWRPHMSWALGPTKKTNKYT